MTVRPTPLSLIVRALVWLLLASAAATAVFIPWSQGRLEPQTDLLALLPPTERDPVAELAVERLASQSSGRALFLVGAGSGEAAASAAADIARALRGHGVWASVHDTVDEFDPRRLLDFYANQRFALMTTQDRRALEDGSASLAQRLQAKLHTPFSWSPRLTLDQDPFGLADAWLADLPQGAGRLQVRDGRLVAEDASRHWVLVQGQLAASPWTTDTQEQAAASLSDVRRALQATHPDAALLHTGPVFYAEASRRTAEQEASQLGAVAMAGTLLMIYGLFRSLRPVALSMLCMGFGILVAVAVTWQVQGQIHLITLVFGASLIGESVDYAVQYFAAHLGAGPRWTPEGGLRMVGSGLLVALSTSLLAYGALWMAPLPALSQIGLFAVAGLSAACLSVFLLLPACVRRPAHHDPARMIVVAERGLQRWQQILHRWRFAIIGLCLAVALPGWLRLEGNDDLRQLASMPTGLVAQDQQIQQLTGMGNSGQFLLVQAPSAQEVLALEEALAPRLVQLQQQGALVAHQRVSAFVPSRAAQQRNRDAWAQHVLAPGTALERVLDDAGVQPVVADHLRHGWRRGADHPLEVDDWLQQPWAAPLKPLWIGATPNGHASVVLPIGLKDKAALVAAVDDLPGVQLVDKPASAGRLLTEARQGATLWLAAATAILLALLTLRYRPARAIALLTPALLGMGLTLGVFGWLGEPVTLPVLMALILVLGVGVNYPIFLWEGSGSLGTTLLGVLVSSATTLLSFGLLVFSSMPALHQFGLTLLVGSTVTIALTPLGVQGRPSKGTA